MVAPLSTYERQQALQMCHIHTYDDVMYMYIYIYYRYMYLSDRCRSDMYIHIIHSCDQIVAFQTSSPRLCPCVESEVAVVQVLTLLCHGIKVD